MRHLSIPVLLLLAATQIVLSGSASCGEDRDKVRYEKYYKDPVIEKMKAQMDSMLAARDSVTSAINAKYKDLKKKEKEEREVIRFEFVGVDKPESPEDFETLFHFPPVAQYYTGTCWCFCTTSFMESEIKRLTGREVKLSEMYTVYWEYVEKARGYIRKRGNQPFAQGGESDGVFIIWDKYGVVPQDLYSGLKGGYDKHNHKLLRQEMFDYLKMVEDKGTWDEESNISHMRVILDKYLGRPPEKFHFEGKEVTPREFLVDILKVDTGDYIQVMSTLSEPYYAAAEFDVPDNWRPTDTYYNLPLHEFFGRIIRAAEDGYTVCIGGDVSEPGYNGFEDAAIIPDFDIPPDYISQDSRELRIFNGTTTDDHGVHLVGHMKKGGRDWFLIKDSSRSARHGKLKGYYFYRGDYVKMKMLTYTVHKDVMKDLENKFSKASNE